MEQATCLCSLNANSLKTTDDIVNDLDNHLLENRLAQAHVMKGYGDIRDMTDEFMGLQVSKLVSSMDVCN